MPKPVRSSIIDQNTTFGSMERRLRLLSHESDPREEARFRRKSPSWARVKERLMCWISQMAILVGIIAAMSLGFVAVGR
jgi:hypothetical protein